MNVCNVKNSTFETVGSQKVAELRVPWHGVPSHPIKTMSLILSLID